MIHKYNDFLLEKQFNLLIDDDLFNLSESFKKIDDRNYEWDFKAKTKLKNFLEKLPKEKIKKYFYDFIDKVKNLPNSKKIVARYSFVFLTFISLNYLVDNPPVGKELPKELQEVIINEVDAESSFYIAQNFVKLAEGGYTDSKDDPGNFIKTPQGKILIGTNHGISAPVLAEWLNKIPTKQDMIDLKYKTALEIYKKNYWDKHNLSEYTNQSLATLIYDGCVNQGSTALKDIIKKALLNQDLSINSPYKIEDIRKINKLDQKLLFKDIKKYREDKYKVAKKRDQHLKGWLNRLSFLDYENN